MRAASLAVYVDAITGSPPNPSGAHRLARAAASRLDEARERIAAVLGTTPSAIVITSGGSEADNLALHGILVGGPQQRSRRAGTENIPGALALAVALEEVARELADGSVAKLAARRDLLATAIVQAVPGAAVTGAGADRLAGHLHLTFDGVRSEELLLLLDQAGVCAAAGSACSSGAPTASPTLLAMGIDEARARGALRLTLATSTTDDEVDAAAQAVIRSVEALRSSG